MINYEIVIGLEIHVELSTKTKIFCGCTTEFGGEANTHVCPVCTGMPGSLPVINKSVIDFAIKTGLALNCEITKHNKFDRKNYFYPDLPKAYQISQLYFPICRNGKVDIEVENIKKTIRIHEIHMEEDAGKLIHDPWDESTLIDYNRCGIPLLEIVTEPDFRTPEDVVSYVEKLRDILTYLDVSDCKMQEGSMRVDVNLSVRPIGEKKLGTRTEMKNINSIKAIYKAIKFEAKRQIEVLEEGGKVFQETRRWDDNKDKSFVMRSKENAQDYRYFPDPDLPVIKISDEWIGKILKDMPELPEQKRQRYIKEFSLTEYEAKVITSEKQIAFLFEDIVKLCNNPKETSNIIMGELMRLLSETSTLPENLNISAKKVSDLILLITEGKINRNVAKEVFEQIFKNNIEPIEYVKEHSLLMLNDENTVSKVIDKVISENEKSVLDFKNGKEKAFGFLVGKTMKELKGKANPQTVNKILKDKLEN